jgi:arabinofuranosyltransferase
VGGFAVWCSGGLETQMFTALGLAGMVLYLAEQSAGVRGHWSGLAFAFAAMTRPEGLLLFGLTGLHRVALKLIRRQWLPSRQDIGWALGFVIPFGLFFLWRYSYYGYPFPNTFYAKGDSGWATARRWGLPYLWDFIQLNRFYVALPLLLPLLRARTAGFGRTAPSGTRAGMRPAVLWSYVALIGLTYGSYIVYVGGDFMAMGRFFVPLMPLVALFVQEGLREAAEGFPWFGRRSGWRRPSERGWRPARLAVVALLVLGAGIANSVALWRENQKMPYMRSGMETIRYLKKFADDRILVGRWMREHLPADTYYSVGGAGASIYASRMKALDVFGLTNEWIAHNVRSGPGGRPGHAKYAPMSYIMRERPDLLCHAGRHQDWMFRPSRADARNWRLRGYRWVCMDPQGLRPQYYCCLKRIDRDLGPHLIEANPR